MTTMSIYATSAETFIRMLNHLDAWLDKGLAHFKDEKAMLAARLAPDMFPLSRQVQVASYFAQICTSRLCGAPEPTFPPEETTLAQLKRDIANAIDVVKSAPQSAYAGAAARSVTYRTGPDTSETTTGEGYLLTFILPNFYFHITTAYAILRNAGVAIGKKDYLTGSST